MSSHSKASKVKKKIPVSLRFTPEMLKTVDSFARSAYMTRTQVIEFAVRTVISAVDKKNKGAPARA